MDYAYRYVSQAAEGVDRAGGSPGAAHRARVLRDQLSILYAMEIDELKNVYDLTRGLLGEFVRAVVHDWLG